MKLYAWQPRGHGQLSFFVCASSEEEARIAVHKAIDVFRAQESWRADYETKGWGTDYYDLSVVEPGVVITNCND